MGAALARSSPSGSAGRHIFAQPLPGRTRWPDTCEAPLLIEAGPMKSKRMGRSNFKLIAQYDARRNEYSVWKHNLTEAQALEAVAEHSARAFSIFIIDQKQ